MIYTLSYLLYIILKYAEVPIGFDTKFDTKFFYKIKKQ